MLYRLEMSSHAYELKTYIENTFSILETEDVLQCN